MSRRYKKLIQSSDEGKDDDFEILEEREISHNKISDSFDLDDFEYPESDSPDCANSKANLPEEQYDSIQADMKNVSEQQEQDDQTEYSSVTKTLEEARKRLDTEISSLTTKFMGELTQYFASLVQGKDKEIEQLRDHIQVQNAKETKLIGDIKNFKAKDQDFQIRFEIAEREQVRLNLKNSKLKNRIAKLKNRRDKFQNSESHASIEGEYPRSTTAFKKLESKVEELNTIISRKDNELTEKNNSLDILRIEMLKTDQTDRLKSQITKLTDQNATNEAIISKLQSKNRKLMYYFTNKGLVSKYKSTTVSPLKSSKSSKSSSLSSTKNLINIDLEVRKGKSNPSLSSSTSPSGLNGSAKRRCKS